MLSKRLLVWLASLQGEPPQVIRSRLGWPLSVPWESPSATSDFRSSIEAHSVSLSLLRKSENGYTMICGVYTLLVWGVCMDSVYFSCTHLFGIKCW